MLIWIQYRRLDTDLESLLAGFKVR